MRLPFFFSDRTITSGGIAPKRLFTLSECEYCDAKRLSAQHFALRFAAKEAFAKALGTGLRAPATLNAIGVTHDALGKPIYLCSDELGARLVQLGVRAHLSISDEREYVVAFAILETLS